MSRHGSATAVLVDYDGTITDRDTLDVLLEHADGERVWREIEDALARREISLRDALDRQAALVRCTLDEADDLLRAQTRFDPAFAPFVERCAALGMAVSIVSSGVEPLIRRALERNGLGELPVVANGVNASAEGWRLHYRDASPNGTDKLAVVRRARDNGETVAYVGDGFSDFDAARAADRRYAKAGRTLAVHLEEAGLAFTAFGSFAEIDPASLR